MTALDQHRLRAAVFAVTGSILMLQMGGSPDAEHAGHDHHAS